MPTVERIPAGEQPTLERFKAMEKKYTLEAVGLYVDADRDMATARAMAQCATHKRQQAGIASRNAEHYRNLVRKLERQLGVKKNRRARPAGTGKDGA